MAVDTPAKIAILGCGPIGLEAALYARFLGYAVAIYEQDPAVAAAVKAWGHVRMFTPFGMNRSPLGLAALAAHDESYQPPADDALLTGHEWREGYLLPLSQTDLLAEHLRLGQRVLRIGKEEIRKGELVGSEERGDWPFRLLLSDQHGREHIDEADVVLDCSGVFRGPPVWLGHGGIPAVGEIGLTSQAALERGLPDVLGKDRPLYAGRHTLLIGCGYSAATNVVALAQLAAEAPLTRVTWITRQVLADDSPGPVCMIEEDRLPERRSLAQQANALAGTSLPEPPSSAVTHWQGSVVESLSRGADDGPYRVRLAGRHAGEFSFDRILANVGYRPDRTLYEELHVHECYASDGPMKLAAALLGQAGGDCLDQQTCGPQSLLTNEPNFYILGAKSYGRRNNFLLAAGLSQIRELFTILGDRPTLDLYATAIELPK